MTVDEAIAALDLLREEQGTDLSNPYCRAIGIAITVLSSLIPSEKEMIDRLLAMSDVPSN